MLCKFKDQVMNQIMRRGGKSESGMGWEWVGLVVTVMGRWDSHSFMLEWDDSIIAIPTFFVLGRPFFNNYTNIIKNKILNTKIILKNIKNKFKVYLTV